jgi:hypothetical protein
LKQVFQTFIEETEIYRVGGAVTYFGRRTINIITAGDEVLFGLSSTSIDLRLAAAFWKARKTIRFNGLVYRILNKDGVLCFRMLTRQVCLWLNLQN